MRWAGGGGGGGCRWRVLLLFSVLMYFFKRTFPVVDTFQSLCTGYYTFK